MENQAFTSPISLPLTPVSMADDELSPIIHEQDGELSYAEVSPVSEDPPLQEARYLTLDEILDLLQTEPDNKLFEAEGDKYLNFFELVERLSESSISPTDASFDIESVSDLFGPSDSSDEDCSPIKADNGELSDLDQYVFYSPNGTPFKIDLTNLIGKSHEDLNKSPPIEIESRAHWCGPQSNSSESPTKAAKGEPGDSDQLLHSPIKINFIDLNDKNQESRIKRPRRANFLKCRTALDHLSGKVEECSILADKNGNEEFAVSPGLQANI